MRQWKSYDGDDDGNGIGSGSGCGGKLSSFVEGV